MTVLLHPELEARFEPEWRQETWQPGMALTDADLCVAQWPWADKEGFTAFVDAATRAGVPVAVWDTAAKGAPLAPGVPTGAVVVASPSRSADYDDAPVAPGLVQPRWFNPVRASGKVATGTTIDLTDPAATYAPRARRYSCVTFTGSTDAVPAALAAAAATGAVVLAEPTIAGSDRLSAGPPDAHVAKAVARHAELQRRLAQPTLRYALQACSTATAASTMLSVGGVRDAWSDRSVSAVVPTMRRAQIPHVLDFVARQSGVPVQLVLVTHGFDGTIEAKTLAEERGLENLVVVPADASLTLGSLMNVGVEAADGRFVSKMDDDNFYGRDYLADLVTAFDFTDAQVVGKWAHYTYLEGSGATFLRFPTAENRYVDLVQGGTLTMTRELALDVRFEDLPRRVDTTFLEKVRQAGGRTYSADRYNFVSVRAASTEGHTWKISDSELLAKPSEQLVFATPWTHVEI